MISPNKENKKNKDSFIYNSNNSNNSFSRKIPTLLRKSTQNVSQSRFFSNPNNNLNIDMSLASNNFTTKITKFSQNNINVNEKQENYQKLLNKVYRTAIPTKKRDSYSEKKILFGNRFEINQSRLLGKGSFGEIYIAQDNQDNYNYVALKIENRTKNYLLKIERNVLELTKDLVGFPQLITFNSQGESNYLAMELLGPNLSDLFEICDGHFTIQTTLLLGIQMIERIKSLHSKNYLHRDIKPENFLIGIGFQSNKVYIIDFGLSKKYKDNKMNHLPYREHRPLTGTTRYASINNHLGIEQSRRDDLESIAYVLIYFLKKRLPWQGMQGSTKQSKYDKILEKKLSVNVDILCKDLPMEFSVYLKYVRNLRFDERPDYDFLKNLFIERLYSLYTEKFYYDWTLRYPDDAKNIIYDFMKVSNKKMDDYYNEDKSSNNEKISEENEDEKSKKSKKIAVFSKSETSSGFGMSSNFNSSKNQKSNNKIEENNNNNNKENNNNKNENKNENNNNNDDDDDDEEQEEEDSDKTKSNIENDNNFSEDYIHNVINEK
jgi:serine/threonine protein kinase